MKKHLLLVIIVLYAVFTYSCKKEYVTITETIMQPAPGAWRVSSFIKDNVDIANQFAGYSFDCNVDGTMRIQSYTNSLLCRWSFIDNNHTLCHFYIVGSDKNSILLKMDDDWEITGRDATHCYFVSRNSQQHQTMTLHKV